jgi:hypothetical protein
MKRNGPAEALGQSRREFTKASGAATAAMPTGNRA